MEYVDIPVFDTIESIISRENFVSPVDIKDSQDDRFDSIIAPYQIYGDKIKCGISSCGTPNLGGVVIRLKDGAETNVGRVCGAGHFNADFKRELRRHDAIQQRRMRIERAINMKSRPDLLDRLDQLCTEYSKLKARRFKLRAILSRGQNDRITRMGKLDDGRIQRHVALKGRDLEAYLEANPGGSAVQEVVVAVIAGVSFMGMTHRTENVIGLLAPLKQVFSSSNDEIALWKDKALSETFKWMGSIEKDIEKLENLALEGRALFEPSNLAKLSLIGVSEADLAKI